MVLGPWIWEAVSSDEFGGGSVADRAPEGRVAARNPRPMQETDGRDLTVAEEISVLRQVPSTT